jgi:hypothetical protein
MTLGVSLAFHLFLIVDYVNAFSDVSGSSCGGINRAFLFLKPNAMVPRALSSVREKLANFNIGVVDEGTLDGHIIDKDMLIDNHYGAIAAKAVMMKPEELEVSPEAAGMFKNAYGVDFKQALDAGTVLNAKDACSFLGLSTDALGDLWAEATPLKFGGGFYCGRIMVRNNSKNNGPTEASVVIFKSSMDSTCRCGR